MKKFLIPLFWILGFLTLFVPMIIASTGHPFGKVASSILFFVAFTFFLVGILFNIIRNKEEFDKSQFITRIVLIAGVFGYNVFNLIKRLI